jgi:CRP/FNR family cyclic AMP-dependent transcriptional regulator
VGRLSKSWLDLLKRDSWFRAISATLRGVLEQESVVRGFAPGTMVYAAGDEPAGFFAVLSGEVRLLYYSSQGKYAFYHILRPFAWFGALSEVDGQHRFSDAIAWTDTRLLHVSHSTLRRTLDEHPEVYRDFALLMSEGLRTVLNLMVEAKAMPPRAHAAQILVGLAVQPQSGGAVPLTQEQLAAMVGVSRQTMNKILQEFERCKLVKLQYGKVIALDSTALAEAARDDGCD